MTMGQFALSLGMAGVGYVIADGLDRFLATYNPSGAEAPKDKFTSDGAGTLANTLNISSAPGLARLGASIAMVAVPAVASAYVDNKHAKTALHGLAAGSFVSAFKTVWNNVLMPMLKPKDATPAELKKSYIARLYPAEVAAAVNRKNAGDTKEAQIPVSSSGSGALSGRQAGVAADVGPFAVAGDSPYPDAAQALRRQAGMSATPGGDYPTVQNQMGTGSGDYPTAAQAMGTGAPAAAGNPGQPGVSEAAWQPGPPPLPGPGPQPQSEDAACGCVGGDDRFSAFLGDQLPDDPFLGVAAV